MPKVILRDDRQETKDIDIALRKLKKKVEDCGVLKVLEQKAQYDRPGVLRNRKKAAAIMRWKRDVLKNQFPQKLY